MTQNIPTAASFLERLRHETAHAHKNLEQLPISAAILSPAVSIDDYATYLEMMHDVVSSAECEIHPDIAGVIADIRDRSKASELSNDLLAIGHAVTRNTVNPFESARRNTAFLLGIAYVVEGSTLGARFILKNINAALGFDEKSGASYFSGYGSKTGSMWKSFVDQMSAYAARTASEDEIIAGANFAFDAIHKHFASR